MKNVNLKNIVLFGFTFFSALSISQAHCLISREIVLNKKLSSLGQCTAVTVQLTKGLFSYENFPNNPYPVEYWAGGFEREARYQETVLTEVIDQCLHDGQVIERKKSVRNAVEPLKFEIQNPNLDPKLKTTYELVPLSERQVQVALAQSEVICQQYP